MISSLTRQFGRVCLATTTSSRLAAAAAAAGSSINTPLMWRSAVAAVAFPSSSSPIFSVRSFASKNSNNKKKKKDKQQKKKQQQQPQSKNASQKDAAKEKGEGVALQHQEWVKFQQSIAVEGFETGQTVTLQTGAKKKQRDSNRRRHSRPTAVEEAFAERQRLTSFGGGLYPPLRYSDEETERLLAEAYAAIPPRAGKRGTRNLKRQAVRWHLVRKIRKKYKRHMAAFQIRKMQERSRKVAAVKQVLEDAPAAVKRDREYQARVFQKWAENMVQEQVDNDDEGREVVGQVLKE